MYLLSYFIATLIWLGAIEGLLVFGNYLFGPGGQVPNIFKRKGREYEFSWVLIKAFRTFGVAMLFTGIFSSIKFYYPEDPKDIGIDQQIKSHHYKANISDYTSFIGRLSYRINDLSFLRFDNINSEENLHLSGKSKVHGQRENPAPLNLTNFSKEGQKWFEYEEAKAEYAVYKNRLKSVALVQQKYQKLFENPYWKSALDSDI